QRVTKNIQFVRCAFKFAFDNALIDRPVRYGQGFKRPSKKTMRLLKAKQGKKLFTADEVRRLLGAAFPQVKAMMLLGINCGFGIPDRGTRPPPAVTVEGPMTDSPRQKTGAPRRCPLWPETVQAIKEALEYRPEPKKEEHAGLAFITRYGDSWHTGT